jgi:murein DD-endopeptidase MepM/ murein hydrolase activator NlpD
MSRSSLLTSALAVLALGAGAMGYAATGQAGEEMRLVGPKGSARPLPATVEPRRAADRTVVVGDREALAAALLRAGVGGLDAALAAEAGGSAFGRVDLWLGEQVGPGARALERLAVRKGPGRTLVVEREGDGFVRRDLIEAVDLTPVRIRLDGGAGLAAGLVEAGLPRAVRDQVLDRVAGERVAAIDLIVAHEAAASGSHYGQPLYLGEYLGDGSIRRWLGEGGELRSLGSGEEPPAGLLRPLPGPVTSSPGLRFHPILRFLRWHRGTDFASPSGTPVQAALGGRVIEAGWRGGYGRAVRVAHGDGSTTLYAHLSEIDVAAGQAVARGAVIGKVGSSGLATGPHLHFEWQRGGATLRPTFGASQIVVTTAAPAQRAALQALLSAPFRLPPDRRS